MAHSGRQFCLASLLADRPNSDGRELIRAGHARSQPSGLVFVWPVGSELFSGSDQDSTNWKSRRRARRLSRSRFFAFLGLSQPGGPRCSEHGDHFPRALRRVEFSMGLQSTHCAKRIQPLRGMGFTGPMRGVLCFEESSALIWDVWGRVVGGWVGEAFVSRVHRINLFGWFATEGQREHFRVAVAFFRHRASCIRFRH